VDLNDFDDWLYGFTGGLDADGGVSWSTGDFTYDGKVDLDAFDAMADFIYIRQLGSLGSLDHAIDVSTLSSSQKTELLDIVASVPEPASAGMLGAIFFGLLMPRRRAKKLRAIP
jgi:hypothetical protein